MSRKEWEIEYYNRKTGYHGIGTFHQLDDEEISVGDWFIVPHIDVVYPNLPKGNRGNGISGSCEGRQNHPAYLKPIVLICKSVTKDHVIADGGYGAWSKDRCLVENK